MAKHGMTTIITTMLTLTIIMAASGAEARPADNKHKSKSKTEPKKRVIPAPAAAPPSSQNRTENSSNGTWAWASAAEVAEFLAGQNAARAAVKVAPLRWDRRLEQYAMWWAQQRRVDCALRHSFGPYGENIFWGSANYDWRPSQGVSAWTSERAFYDPSSNSCAPGHMCGHYTQIVWRSTSAVGCARVACLNRQIFIVCSYAPPGNYLGQRPY